MSYKKFTMHAYSGNHSIMSELFKQLRIYNNLSFGAIQFKSYNNATGAFAFRLALNFSLHA
jgi:hypothetical protein